VACPDRQLIYAVVHDITEQKLAQQALSQSEQHFRTLFAEAPVSFIEQDLSGVVDYLEQLNIPAEADIPAYLREHPEVVAQCERHRKLVRTNLAALSLAGANDLESLFSSLATQDSCDTSRVWALVIAAVRQRAVKFAYESRMATLDGQWRDVICQWSVLQSSQDEWARVLWSIVDTTDHKEAEAQRLQAATLRAQVEAEHRITESLKRSNELLQEFAIVASHDLQEPLRKIQAYCNLLATNFSQQIGETGREYLQRIGSAADRMRNMINDLLALARVATRANPFEPVDLEAAAREVLTDLEVAIQRSQAEVEVGDLPRISADPTQIRQLLQNLLENALKFRKPNEPPRVSVKGRVLPAPSGALSPAGASAPFCEITVEDNGIGFDEKCSEEIFRPFQRLHGRGEYEGTGIGLAICQKIVTRHHGKIVAEGHPNSGARFTVTLPVSQSESEITS
jgi:signal transduction histidine kinase